MSSLGFRLKCCICDSVGGPDVRLFSFPKSQEKSKKWLQIFNREDLLKLDSSYLMANRRVCSKHFSDWSFSGTDKKRLIRFALPETAEPPSAPIEIKFQDASAASSVSPRLHSATTVFAVSSISSGHHTTVSKIVAPSIGSGPRVAVPSVTLQSQVAVRERATPSINPCPQDGPINSLPFVPLSSTFKRSREAQIILNQRSTISRLRKKIEKLKVSFNQKLKSKLTPDMYAFVMSQIRQGGRSNKGRRWEKEDKAFALNVYKKSPGVYRLLSEKLALPSKATLLRYR